MKTSFPPHHPRRWSAAPFASLTAALLLCHTPLHAQPPQPQRPNATPQPTPASLQPAPVQPQTSPSSPSTHTPKPAALPAAIGQDAVVLEIRFPRQKQTERVVIGLHDTAAPATVENFKKLTRRRFYNGLRFHRVFPDSLVQTGDPLSRRTSSPVLGTGGPGYTLPPEIRLPVRAGSVAMARIEGPSNPTKLSNGSQFFIALRDLPALDGNYTVFGTVLEGMETLRRISTTRADTNDLPLEKITIRRASIHTLSLP